MVALRVLHRGERTDRRLSRASKVTDACIMNRLHRMPTAAKLAIASACVCPLSFFLCRLATPDYQLSLSLRADWTKLLVTEACALVPALILARGVRGGRWLWLAWLVWSAEYTLRHSAVPGRTGLSLVLLSIYIGWAVKGLIAFMLLVRNADSSARPSQDDHQPENPRPPGIAQRASAGKAGGRRLASWFRKAIPSNP